MATRSALIALLAIASWSAASAARAGYEVLDLLIGRWDVRVKTLKPAPADVTYREKYEWVLGRKYLRGQTFDKSDGTEDISFGTYDAKFDGYPFWIFSSSGTYLYLAPATWDARTRTMEWTNPPNSDVYYNTRVKFTDKGRHWTVQVKDWKGTVLLHQEGNAVRVGN
jgi:hypothetical protein